MADGNITVEVNTKAAQAELERLRAENAALKHDLQYARDGLIRGRTRMREDNERLRAALEAVLAWGTDETYERAKAACDTARALLGPNVAGNRLAEGKSELTGLLGGPARSEKE